jgi:hypothetical protein
MFVVVKCGRDSVGSLLELELTIIENMEQSTVHG